MGGTGVEAQQQITQSNGCKLKDNTASTEKQQFLNIPLLSFPKQQFTFVHPQIKSKPRKTGGTIYAKKD